MKKPKNQHWVPQFYLRHFATPETRETDEPQVWVFSQEETDGEERLTNIKNVCARRYMYTPLDASGQRVWALETRLSELEDHLAPWWRALDAELLDFGDPDVRRLFALFVAIMYLRSDHVLRGVEDIHRQLVSLYETAPKRLDGSPDIELMDAAGVVHRLDAGDWDEYRAWGRNDHRRFFARTIQTEAVRIAEMFLPKRWSVLFSPDDAFVTSDRPVGVHDPSGATCGLLAAGAMVTFPLTPRRVLVMDDRLQEPANQYYPINRGSIGALNGIVWRHARFFITGRPISEVLTELVTAACDTGVA